MTSSHIILQTVPIDFQWPTVDPFLFCVHHLDHYPAGNGAFGPAASLAGRQIGQDFVGIDGWRMYHGATVPGFPQHPHRGFETVTIVRQGRIDHSDSLGAAARFGGGDVQWLTAGRGIVHSEMFPLLHDDHPNTAELFQIWLNLPASQKMAEPHFTMMWNEDIPRRIEPEDSEGPLATVTVIAGRLAEIAAAPPPPESWASHPDGDVAIWLIDMEPGSQCTLPPAQPGSNRVLYVFEGEHLDIGGESIAAGNAAVIEPSLQVVLRAVGDVRVLMLQGRPIGEPVAQYGPFVMNTNAEIEQAFDDYRRTQFGGWPWSADGPVHGTEEDRFARFPDGSVQRPKLRS